MIKIFYGDEKRLKLLNNNIKTMDYISFESIEDLVDESSKKNLFGSNPTLVLRRAEKIKNLSALSKIPKDRDVIIEAEDIDQKFIIKFPKIECEKIECRYNTRSVANDLSEKMDIPHDEAYKLASLISSNHEQEIEKLINFFYKKPFSFEDAERLIVQKESVDIFKSLEALIKGNKTLAIQYVEENKGIPFLYAMMQSLKVILKIKILNLNTQSYNSFMKDTYPKFKKILPHPYFVFKHLYISKRFSKDKISDLIFKTLQAEVDIRQGTPSSISLLNLIRSF